MTSGRTSSREGSSRPSAPLEAEWLPQARSHLLMSDSRIGPFIEVNKSSHSFLWFANVIETHKEDASQARMLAKLYGFLYDFLPGGFTGKWSHIRGNDVMDILLCQRKDMAVSRHKATNNVQASFDYLEKWMKKGKDWREAVKKDSNLARKKGPRKTLTRYSPANLVALLVLSYPDPKYRQWVGRLQIDWMLEEKVQVHDGFWKGLTGDDIPLIFQLNETRTSELPLLADYDRLFGSDFPGAGEDIQPFLPRWASKLNRSLDEASAVEEPEIGSVEDDDGSGDSGSDESDHVVPTAKKSVGGEASPAVVDLMQTSDDDSGSDDLSDIDTTDVSEPTKPDTAVVKPNGTSVKHPDDTVVKQPNGTVENEPTADDLVVLSTLLADYAVLSTPSEGDLLGWFAQKMSDAGDQDVLTRWCERWAERMDEVVSYEEQVIVRSLFDRSIRMLHCLDCGEPCYKAFTDAFMLLDIEYGRARPLPSGDEENKSMDRVRRLPITKPLVDLEAELALLARDDSVRGLLDEIFREQLAFIVELFTSELFNTHLQNVLALETARMKTAVNKARAKALPEPLHELVGRMDKSLIASLKLSKWQVRDLALSKGHAESILTGWQARIYRQDHSTPGALSTTQYKPVQPKEVEVVGHDMDSPLRAKVRSLFGDLDEPFVAAHGDAWAVCRKHAQMSPHKPSSSAEPTQSQKSSLPPETPARQGAKESPPFNPFTGLLGKRACSTDLRKAKIPRLTPGSMQDSIAELRNDVSVGNERLRDDLKTLIVSARDEVLESAEARSAQVYSKVGKKVAKTTQQVETKIQSRVEALETRMVDQIRSVKDDLESRMAKKTLDMEAKLQSVMDSFTAALDRGVAEHGQQLDMKTRAVTDILHDLSEKLSAHEQCQTRTSPLPGKEGYLAAHCPAPDGWDQDSYDDALLRAGWHYIASFGIPDDGVLADPDSFEATVERYPNLDRQHVATALEHVHHQAYRRPINREA